jgi:hypothetical protein
MRDTGEIAPNCPLGGSQQYENLVVELPSGARYESSLLQSARCTVMFRDKDKFTRRAKYQRSAGVEGAISNRNRLRRSSLGSWHQRLNHLVCRGEGR